MAEELLSVGLDVGTTSSQMILSRLTVENKASAFAVPAMHITKREILYRSPIHFTPLLNEELVDTQALRLLVEAEYRAAGITREQVDTGAIIITGETSRKENARRVLEALSHLAGDFVVTAAGPDLESILAAKGAGALRFSEDSGKPVLHVDIGGGTSNLALIQKGKILRTGCLNVGGRLIKLDPLGRLTYVSPVIQEVFPLQPGDTPTRAQLDALAGLLTQTLEVAAGLRPANGPFERLLTAEASGWMPPEEEVLLSFSGGVAECIAEEKPELCFGDLGPILGQHIRRSLLCAAPHRIARESIRATVIGAGCHSTTLSGSTVFFRNVTLPLKNLPVVRIAPGESLPQVLPQRLSLHPEAAVIALEGYAAPTYTQIRELADTLLQSAGSKVYVCLEQDMAKALGQALAARLGARGEILCLDSIQVTAESYLDIGLPVGPALPVVVKTLVLER